MRTMIVGGVVLAVLSVLGVQRSRIGKMKSAMHAVKTENASLQAITASHEQTHHVLRSSIQRTQKVIAQQREVDAGDDSDTALYDWLREQSAPESSRNASRGPQAASKHGAPRLSKAKARNYSGTQK